MDGCEGDIYVFGDETSYKGLLSVRNACILNCCSIKSNSFDVRQTDFFAYTFKFGLLISRESCSPPKYKLWPPEHKALALKDKVSDHPTTKQPGLYLHSSILHILFEML